MVALVFALAQVADTTKFGIDVAEVGIDFLHSAARFHLHETNHVQQLLILDFHTIFNGLAVQLVRGRFLHC